MQKNQEAKLQDEPKDELAKKKQKKQKKKKKKKKKKQILQRQWQRSLWRGRARHSTLHAKSYANPWHHIDPETQQRTKLEESEELTRRPQGPTRRERSV